MSFPITLNQVVNLPDLGINAQSFRFGALTVESEKYICVKDTAADGSSQVVTIDMPAGNAVSKKPMKAEAALMNPVDNVIALKGKTDGTPGNFIQVFNLDTKDKLGVHQFTENVVFWRWLAPRVLALVTDKAVFHWTLDGTAAPVRLYERAGKLAETSTQIINYAADSRMQWCLLTGISTPDGGKTIEGAMQLYSVEKKQQQLLEGHAGNFGNIHVDDSGVPKSLFVFAERKAGTLQSRLHIMDIYAPRGEGLPAPFKVVADITYPPEAPTDFPVGMHLSEKYGVVYLISKAGFLFLFDLASGALIFRHRVTPDTVFVSTYNATSGGMLAVNRKGQVLSCSVNEEAIVQYIQNNLRHLPNCQQIATSLALRYGLPGADEVFIQQFSQAFARGDYRTAALVAAKAKSGCLRTANTIQQFKAVGAQAIPGQPSPILQYFSALLEVGKLNALESLELVRPVVAQGRRELLQKWLQEDKLECSEELGDVVKPLDGKLALPIYVRANASAKVIQALMEQGQFEQIVAYAKKTGYQADYSFLLRNMVAVNPEGAVQFSKQLLDNQPPLIDINQVVDVLLAGGRFKEVSSILIDFLKPNRPEHAALQTKLLEVNLIHAPQVAEAIFQMGMLSHYDRRYIAQLCEKAGLAQRALEHYGDVADIKRVMLSNPASMNPEFLQQFLGRMEPDVCLEVLADMLRSNRQNMQVVVQAAIKYHERIGAEKLVKMFETFQSHEGVFYFLGAILAFSKDPEIHFKYIEAAAKLNHVSEVERVCRESSVYEPVRVKDFLKQAKLPDPRPLIFVCDQHGFVAELAEYLYSNSLMKYIEVYVCKVNPAQTPVVVGTLIDLDCSEDFLKGLLQNVRGLCPVKPLVEEVEKRNRLQLLLQWLEGRLQEGTQEPELHNALAKIYIDTNRDAENFLKTNAFYDSKVVGKYCEERDPHLAYTAYKRAWGTCDAELVEVTNKNGLFRLQARYLVERQSQELWGLVLQADNKYRRSVIDQVVATALPESTNPDEVSATVKAFIAADLPNELIELLEKIVLHNSADFSSHRNLQNLLILTAIKADKTRVMDYINRLDNYDGPEIAKIALGEAYQLHEEAFTIYRKFNLHSEAMDVLLNNLESLDRAAEFAARVSMPEVWSKLGRAQLGQNQVVEAIESYLKAEDAADYKDVIAAAVREETFDELVKFLQMARKKQKDAMIDSELVYGMAKAERLADLQDFVGGTNTANLQAIGDRLFEEGHYKAAKILYAKIPNNARLASCHVHLGEFEKAVDAAKKANNPKTWKEINFACVAAKEFKAAQLAGMNIIVHPDHLEEVVLHYEKGGYFEELLALLEAGLGSERAHVGLYTELGVLYAKFKPEKLRDYTKVNQAKLNLPKLIRACERHYHWEQAVVLYQAYGEFDQAANTMMAHSTSGAFQHDRFVAVMQKVSNTELFYRSITFYLEEQPMQLCSLLTAIAPKVDHARVVSQMRKAGHLPLVVPYLKAVQTHNIREVNEALNELYLEAEDHEGLRQSIEDFDGFDQLALAAKLEKHEVTEMRRLAGVLYKKNKRHKQAIELAKLDKQYRDAMETANASANQELAEGLLKYFVEIGDKDCFAACLLVCYSLIRPDVAMELAWRNRYMDQCMPYLIQVMREYTGRVDALDRKIEKKEEQADKSKSAPNDYDPSMMMGHGPMLGGFGNQLALMPPPGTMASVPSPQSFPGTQASLGGGMGGMGMGMGGAPAGFPQQGFPQQPGFPGPMGGRPF